MSARRIRQVLGLVLILLGTVVALVQVFSQPDEMTGAWCFLAGVLMAYGVEHVYTNRQDVDAS